MSGYEYEFDHANDKSWLVLPDGTRQLISASDRSAMTDGLHELARRITALETKLDHLLSRLEKAAERD